MKPIEWWKQLREEYRSWPEGWRAKMWWNIAAIMFLCGLCEFAYRNPGVIIAIQIFALGFISAAFHYWRKFDMERRKSAALAQAVKDLAHGELRRGFKEFLAENPPEAGAKLLVDGEPEPTKWKH